MRTRINYQSSGFWRASDAVKDPYPEANWGSVVLFLPSGGMIEAKVNVLGRDSSGILFGRIATQHPDQEAQFYYREGDVIPIKDTGDTEEFWEREIPVYLFDGDPDEDIHGMLSGQLEELFIRLVEEGELRPSTSNLKVFLQANTALDGEALDGLINDFRMRLKGEHNFDVVVSGDYTPEVDTEEL